MTTPRTDKYKGTWASTWQDGISIFEHAQKLERELAELKRHYGIPKPSRAHTL